jgi:hypothetical protein
MQLVKTEVKKNNQANNIIIVDASCLAETESMWSVWRKTDFWQADAAPAPAAPVAPAPPRPRPAVDGQAVGVSTWQGCQSLPFKKRNTKAIFFFLTGFS